MDSCSVPPQVATSLLKRKCRQAGLNDLKAHSVHSVRGLHACRRRAAVDRLD